jgi:hypothetical protein
MQILDNLIPPSYQNDLVNLFYHGDFPWYYHASTTAVTEAQLLLPSANSFTDSNTVERPQFGHSFVVNGKITSDYYRTISPMLYFLEARTGYKPSQVLRIKANMLLKDTTYPNNSYHEPHTDVYGLAPTGLTSMIYYLDDSDGDTYFFDQEFNGGQLPGAVTTHHRQTPTKGTAVVFSSNRFHASSSPRQYARRAVLNFVLAD